MTAEPAAQQLLRAHLAAGARDRERFIIQTFLALTLVSLAAVIASAPADRRAEIAQHLALFAPPLGFQVVVLAALRRGWFHAALPWVDVAVQTSMIAAPFAAAASAPGASFAGANAMLLGWIVIVMISGLRTSAVISVAAGAIAATEYLTIAFAVAGPLTGEARSLVITGGALLAVAGVAAAAIATYIIGQAGAALRAVREQDLMGKYLMHERLGAGGMAEVFRATYSPEGGFEKIVAVKRVLPAVAGAADARMLLAMFREEAGLCARLSHPNVIQVLDAGRFRGSYVVAMEYVDGVPLSRLLRSGALAPCAIAFVAAELAAALDYIHSRTGDDGRSLDLVHRDVNPPNVLVSRLGDVKLADFGVAHAIGRASLDAERVYGKPGYLAPEQLHPESTDAIDGRADLFALGLTLYEMIAGVPLVAADFRIPEAELAATPLGAQLPDELRRLVASLLAVRRGDRPATGAVVRDRLLALTGAFAPFPGGRGELARAVRAALDRPADVTVGPPTAATVRAASR